MKGKKLVTNVRESDGRFGLRLESKAAVQRDLEREAARRQREAQVVEENADFLASVGIDPSEAAFLFA